jgi:uncharacterized protein (DUF58 family)
VALKRSATVAASGLLLTLVALMFDASPLFVPGIALAALGFLTPVWVGLAAGGTTVRRLLGAERVIEGEPVQVTIEIRRGLFRPPGLELAGGLDAETTWQGSLARQRRVTVDAVARFPRRGRRRFPPPAVIVRDPLDLARAIRSGDRGDELLVLPRTEPVNWLGRDLGAASVPVAGHTPSEPVAAAELDGLRPYRVGTPASRIHWAALARGAGLLERRMKADADTRPLVVLDARCPDPELPALDAAVRAAASLAVELGRRGGCGLLMPGERRPIEIDPELRAWPAAHARLALVRGGPDSRLPAISPGSRLGRVFLVAAEAPRRLPAALRQPGQPAAVLVVPGAAGGPSARAEPAFEVAGCRGYLLGGTRRARRDGRDGPDGRDGRDAPVARGAV